MNTPSQQSDIRQSFEERRPLDPVLSSDNDENKRVVTSPQSALSGKYSHTDVDAEIDMHLHLSSSTGTASKHSSLSGRSHKYGRAPAPEHTRVISPRSGAQGEENEMADHLDNSTSIRMDYSTSMRSMGGPAAADPAMGSSRPSSEYGQQASLTGTNSTIMHTNLSADKFMMRAMDRQQGREEKKEEEERPVPGGEDVDGRGPHTCPTCHPTKTGWMN
jgi:hypothetical protein